MHMGDLLFYSGIATTVAALLLGVVLFVVFKLKWHRLKAKLDQEYGAIEKGQKNTRSDD